MRFSLLLCTLLATCSPAGPQPAEAARLDGADVYACEAFFQSPQDDADKARKADAALRLVEAGTKSTGISVWAGPLTGAQADSLMVAGCAHFDGMTLDKILEPVSEAEHPTPP